MPISFDAALGIHDQALKLRSQRAELLASNIANSDTPGYKARDIDFKTALQTVQAQKSAQGFADAHKLSVTHSNHIQTNTTTSMSGETKYRVPHQASLDGNTVDSQTEKSAFADNALRYQASLTFLDGKFKGLISALKGE